MSSFTLEIVLSRFREDLLASLELICNPATFDANTDMRITIYNKGGDDLEEILTSSLNKKRNSSPRIMDAIRRFIDDKKRFQIVNVENLGREADTYIYHILQNYLLLADVTVFLPASCMNDIKIEHTRQLFQRVNSTKNSVLAGQWIIPSVRGRLGKFMIKKWSGTDSNNAKTLELSASVACLPATRRPYALWYDHFFPNITTHVVSYYSMFAISSVHVRRKEKSYYQQFFDELHVHINPETGHFMERSWEAIFFPLPEECLYAAKLPQQDQHIDNDVQHKSIANATFSQLLSAYSTKSVRRSELVPSSDATRPTVLDNIGKSFDNEINSKRKREDNIVEDDRAL